MVISALPLKADMEADFAIVGYVPKADVNFISVNIEISLDVGMIFQYILKYEEGSCRFGIGCPRPG